MIRYDMGRLSGHSPDGSYGSCLKEEWTKNTNPFVHNLVLPYLVVFGYTLMDWVATYKGSHLPSHVQSLTISL